MTAISDPVRLTVPPPGRSETDLERCDRNLAELLGELRVALPGVQVLFAFLLVVPFNQGFVRVSEVGRVVYLVTLLTTLLSAILLIAPTLVHRIHFRLGEKPYVVDAANRLMVCGLSVFAVAMAGAVLLVTLFLFGSAVAIAVTASVAVAVGAIWFWMPLRRRRARHGYWRRARAGVASTIVWSARDDETAARRAG